MRVARAGFPVRLGVFDSLSRVVVVFNPVDKNAQNSLVIYSTHRFRFGAARDKFQTDDSRMANRGRLDEGTILNENTAQSSGDHDDAPLARKKGWGGGGRPPTKYIVAHRFVRRGFSTTRNE